ncbi:MAG TPA: mannose-1-phosphate guanylyltransferase [Candidatus Omnitrophica bacterium]|nr:mannose-1-phosphate guanylyltransferase [Candidatus Omnitrophota bacterium]
MRNLYAVILAGGKGERFWPMSRETYPKQLLSIGTDLSTCGQASQQAGKSMIEESVRRISSLVSSDRLLIVTGAILKEKIQKLLPHIPPENIIGEPMGKNTAPAIGVGAMVVERKDKDGILVVLTADHIIKNEERFLQIIRVGATIAKEGDYLVTIGIKPTHPETGYGHIKPAQRISWAGDGENVEVFKVEKFVEKPDIEKAKEYTKKGYLWNSGMFIWKASTILKAFRAYMPALYEGLMEIKNSLGSEKQQQTMRKVYKALEGESIDYGVMEKSKDVYVIQGDFPWNDVGSWSALEDIYPKDDMGNVKIGETAEIDTKNSILVARNRLIATVGVENMIVVETDDAVLICHKSKAQKVKELVRKIKKW